jgi:hypothetical protein
MGAGWAFRREYRVVVRDLREPLPAERSVAGARWRLLAPPDASATGGVRFGTGGAVELALGP